MKLSMFASLVRKRRLWAFALGCTFLNFADAPAAFRDSDNAVTPIYAFEFLTFKSAHPEKTFLEVFCQIPTDNLQFVKFKDGFFASYRLAITLRDSSGAETEGESFIDSVRVKTFRDIDRVRPIRLVRFSFLVTPGKYQARVVLRDLETLRHLTFAKEVEIADYERTDLCLSALQIATSITPSNERGILVKNGQKIFPNIPRIVGSGLDVLQVYSEIYHLQCSNGRLSKGFKALYTILNEKGERVKSLERRNQKPGNASFLTAAIPIEDLESGRYRLVLRVEDLDTATATEKSTNFLVIKPGMDAGFYSKLLVKAYGEDVRF